jgi:NAD(P)-dependent dehydrogenase (short-subunit alcohol dehydrogenase family)
MAERPIPDPIRPMATFAPGLFAGRVAVVTGGGTGIGRETALGFARYGGHVVVAGRTEESLQATAKEVAALASGVECLVVPTNIREVDQVERLRDATLERFGKVDYLINNAGGQFPALPSQISDKGWRSVVDLNLNGTWNMVSRFMTPMTEAGYGAIVNVVHVFSFDRGAPGFAHSGAARAGVVSLTRTMALVTEQVKTLRTSGMGRSVNVRENPVHPEDPVHPSYRRSSCDASRSTSTPRSAWS